MLDLPVTQCYTVHGSDGQTSPTRMDREVCLKPPSGLGFRPPGHHPLYSSRGFVALPGNPGSPGAGRSGRHPHDVALSSRPHLLIVS